MTVKTLLYAQHNYCMELFHWKILVCLRKERLHIPTTFADFLTPAICVLNANSGSVHPNTRRVLLKQMILELFRQCCVSGPSFYVTVIKDDNLTSTNCLNVCFFFWWCQLTPLSTIFQYDRGGQFYWWRNRDDPEKNHWPVHLVLIDIRTHISGDRQATHYMYVHFFVCN